MARSTFRSQKGKSTPRLEDFSWQGFEPGQKWSKREGFAAVSNAMAGVGRLKRIWKDVFRVEGAIQEIPPFTTTTTSSTRARRGGSCLGVIL